MQIDTENSVAMTSEHKYILMQLTPSDGLDIYEMLQHIGKVENNFVNETYGMTVEQWREWLRVQDSWSRGENLPEGYVPQTTYWLFVDDVPVGYGKLRTRLTEQSRKNGGNIGYAIDSRFRGLGYGTKLMQLLIETARTSGIDERVFTVAKGNWASRRAIEKCGARLVDESDDIWYLEV